MMKVITALATLAISLAAASAQVIPYFPPFISALPDMQLRRDAAVAHKLRFDSRFSIPSSNGEFIQSVIRLAQAEKRTVRTERQWVRGTEFINIWVSKRK